MALHVVYLEFNQLMFIFRKLKKEVTLTQIQAVKLKMIKILKNHLLVVVYLEALSN